MTAKYSAHEISKALFETDPMNTCCKENDCFDEYDNVAEALKQRIDASETLEQAMTAELSRWFFGGEAFDTGRLTPVIELLSKEGE